MVLAIGVVCLVSLHLSNLQPTVTQKSLMLIVLLPAQNYDLKTSKCYR